MSKKLIDYTDSTVRQSFIGGSDAAAVLGLSRWKTPLKLWAEKTGQIAPEIIDSEAAELGTELEDYVARRFMKKAEKTVRRVNETIFHPNYPFLAANIDRRVDGEGAILECKTAGHFAGKEWVDEEIPQEYIIQCMHYLGVTGAPRAYIAVLIGNKEFKWKIIERDENAIRQMIEKEVYFWNTFVVPNVMPMQITSKDSDTLYALFPNAEPETVIPIDADMDKELELRNALVQDSIALEKQIEQKDNMIKAFLKENEAAESDFFKVTWKNQSQKRVDTDKLKSEYTDIYTQVLKQISFRKLTVKAKTLKGE